MNPVRTVLDEFEDLTAMILDGTAGDADRVRFNEIVQEYPEFRSIWLEQVRLHALLVCRGGEADATGYDPMRTSGTLRGMGRCARARLPLASEMPPGYRLNDQSAPWPTPAPLIGGLTPRKDKNSWPPGYRLNDQSAPWLIPAPLEGRGKRRLPVDATERVLPAAAVPAVSVVVGAVGAAETCGRRMSVRFRKLAALAAAMGLVATGLWLAAGGGRGAAAVAPVAGRLSPVEILHRWGSCNLEVPERLPGTLRMTNGRITARLSSGIELVLLGPFELEIRTPMEAKLLSGRLLAEVSETSGGFMLRTPDFEMWDNGALFGVTVTEDGSDVFVFGGEVQVVEASGEPVDICRAGEGARARRDGSGAVKIAADWPEAERMLATASERGVLKYPDEALKAACQISDLWAAEWMPKVVTPARPVPGLRGSRQLAIGNGQSAIGNGQSAIGNGQSAIGNGQSAIGNGQSAMGNGQSAMGNGQWAMGNRQSAIANRQSPIANRQSASGVLGPGSATIASKGAASCPPPKGTTLNNGGVAPASTIAAISPRKEEEEMKATAKTAAAVTAAALMGAGVAWAVPTVSNVNMAQIPNTRQVQVTYDLADENAVVTLSIETNGVAIPDSAVTRLSGDVCKVVGIGAGKTILWNAGADWPENVTDSAKARVTAWSVDAPPQVMVIDLTPGPTAVTYPVYYYTSAEALPHGGLTNSIYKNTHLVMRKLNSGSFSMGEGTPVTVTLTNDFYAGVFPVTQGQWFNVMGSARSAYYTDEASRAFRPMEQVSYFDIRENPVNSAISPNWPQSDDVHADSFMGKLRTKAELSGFDLPTEAQWEYACRAGTTTYYNDGLGTPSDTTSNAQMNVLGRYERNGGKVWNGSAWVNPAAACDAANGTAIVGSYAPNAWGLYDTHGNVWEWCLDWHASALTGGTDPRGAGSGSTRVVRGGSRGNAASSCRAAVRIGLAPSTRGDMFGCRLVRTLP